MLREATPKLIEACWLWLSLPIVVLHVRITFKNSCITDACVLPLQIQLLFWKIRFHSGPLKANRSNVCPEAKTAWVNKDLSLWKERTPCLMFIDGIGEKYL